MIDAADGPCSVWSENHRKARKPHACHECGRQIEPGERYLTIFTVFEGDASHHKVCAHCEVVCEWLRKNCGGFLLSMVYEDISEHVDEYNRRDLARLQIGMKHDWKRLRKEGLMPIPKLPDPIKLGELRG